MTDIPAAADGAQNTIVAPPQKPAIKVNKFTYHGQLGSLYGLWLKKFFLSIITLGIYSFWGKTNIRRYIVGAVELDGDRFEYLGTGKELFIGILKIFPFYILLVIAVVALQKMYGEDAGNVALLPVFLVIPAAVYSAFRYRFNRLSWRGIRTRMAGSAISYTGLYFKGFFMKLFTLGFLSPSVDLERWDYQVKHMQFGDIPFSFKGDPSRLTKSNLTTLLLAIPTLGLSRTWYAATLQQEKMRGLALGPVRFRSTAKGGDFIGLAFGNLGIIIITVGLGMPIILQRNVRFFTKFLAIGGDLSQLTVSQAPKAGPGDAEGLQNLFDIDLGVIGA